jgi:8-oxo-dGTP pyrophosphatase MutT (NUDIX family)
MKIATLGLIIKDGSVLLGEKKKGKFAAGTLNGPGGKVEGSETLLECLVRETKEEWDIDLVEEDVEKVARILFHFGGTPDFEVHVFRAGRFTGELHETDEARCPEWFSIDALPVERMLESDREWLSKASRGERFCANAYYTDQANGFERIDFLPVDF